MNSPLYTQSLTKRFAEHTALTGITLAIPAGSMVGLLGRNGSGKTTLLNLACGLLLPTSGTCTTLGRASGDLDTPELSRLGVVFQEGRFLEWMTVAQQLEYAAAFYPRWDRDREKRLLAELELRTERKIGQLSSGDQQKVGLLLGVCHHPELLLLDEPISALDPIARARLLEFLLGLLREDECTIVISSHILNDIERIVDWIVCLDRGELAVSASFDEVREAYAEWIVTAPRGGLPARFPEPFVLSQTINAHQARLCVRHSDLAARQFETTYGVAVTSRPLNLDQLFPLLVQERRGVQ
jgi:ABC-2 type transport system ATP-binding protein